MYIPEIPHTMFSMRPVNGGEEISLPNPDYESGRSIIATMVNSARNANAVVTAQKIGRDQDKFEMTWALLSKEEWEAMLRFWNQNFYFSFTYYSRVEGTKITRKFYISDREDKPYNVDGEGIPEAYRECSATFVDTGEGD